MIKNLRRLKEFGIFKDCSNAGLNDFGKLNLIYGWNGSGKSTLSFLFESLEKKSLPDPSKIRSPEFEIGCESGISITTENVGNSSLNVRTFNEHFVEANIDWNKSVKSVLLVSEKNISEHQRLKKLQGEDDADSKLHASEIVEVARVEKEISEFLSMSAKRTKTALQVIDTKDSHYMNYNKAKLRAFIEKHESGVKDIESILDDRKIIETTNAAKPESKPTVKTTLKELDPETFKLAKGRLDTLLKERIASSTVDRLKEHADIQSWVSVGLEIHKTHDVTKCEFCLNDISEVRLEELETHFSDEFQKYKARLTRAVVWLDGKSISLDSLPSAADLFEEFKIEYRQQHDSVESAANKLNAVFLEWRNQVARKLENPFDNSISIPEYDQQLVTKCNQAIADVVEIIDKHNRKVDNFIAETMKSKQTLELHYAAVEVQSFNYHSNISDVDIRKKKNSKLAERIQVRRREMKVVEATLSDEQLGAEQFNSALHKFLGRSDISLRFEKKVGGYEIVRNDLGTHDGNLSEGEKTAIAFVLFMTKLEEGGNRLKDTIVVIDDPVSSFDANHIFHAYSFLRNRCSDAKQLIVLTHNFTFFKLMRDWFQNNNINRSRKIPPRDPIAYFYVIETSTELPRKSKLVNADSSIVDYDSEYHYLFSRLYRFNEKQRLMVDDAYLTANIARKLLECFFGFKYPSQKSDLGTLLECGLRGCTRANKDTKEKIYRFINKYSHGGTIEVNQDAAENLFGEGQNVIKDIFEWIEEVDGVHFEEMVSVATV